MTRTLFFLTCLVAMLVALTAFMIRAELAYPGVSPLFQLEKGQPDGHLFGTVALTHSVYCHLAVMLLGTTMTSAARDKGAPLARIFRGIGIIVSAATVSLLVLAQMDATVSPDAVAGWSLYPAMPLMDPSVLGIVMDALNINDLQYANMTLYFMLPATGMLYLGAFAMLSTVSGFGWASLMGAIVVALVVVAGGPNIIATGLPFGPSGFFLLVLPFVGCAAMRLIDDSPPAWLLVLIVGAMSTMAGHIAVLSQPDVYYVADTMAGVGLLYLFPLGLAWFALPAVLLFVSDTRLPFGMVCVLTGAITLGLATWLTPLIQVGLAGQPMRYVDYPDAFAQLNLTATAGVVLFSLIYVGVMIIIRRNRA